MYIKIILKRETMKRVLKPKNLYQKLENAKKALKYTYQSEVGFKRIVKSFVVFSFVALIIPIESYLKAVLIISLMFPISAEILNTAIERAVDTATSEYRDSAKKSKDIASAFVYSSIFTTFLIWCSVLFFGFTS